MTIKTVLTCPLGHKCEEVKDNAIQRCAWFVKLAGQNPQTGEVADEQGCAMSWLPVLLVENARVSRGTSAAVESFRNEVASASRFATDVMVTNVLTARSPTQMVTHNSQDTNHIGTLT